ncbi:MAG TPA: 2-isopropylmalate synthase [Thermoplasmata archaeon]|nr:2-isopropylmalate synthase [Thermoplasmata archaeon]
MVLADEQLVRDYLTASGIPATLPKTFQLWDETMRDGEQTPGVHFTPEEKLELATLMSGMGVDIMDVGIPVVSKEEHRAVKLVADAGLEASILAAARAVRRDVEACVECGVDEVSVFIACSDLHLKYKLNMTREQVLQRSVAECEYARDHGLKVTFVTEDTFRADMDYVVQLYNACIDAGAVRVVFADTVGLMTPAGMQWWLGQVKPRLKPAQLSVHCHNDFGLAVANSLAAMESGVEVPHVCVNGIGERSGNASFEELVLLLETLYHYDTGIDTSRLYELSRRVEELTGIPVAVNKAVVGYNAFSHESGIHADGVIKHSWTYEPIQPEKIGRERRFIFGKHTGSTAVEDKLNRHAVAYTKEQLAAVVSGIKELAEKRTKADQQAFIELYRDREEKRRGVSDEEFWAIAKKAGLRVPKGQGR